MTRYQPPEGEEPPLGSFYMGRMQPPEPPPRRRMPKGLVGSIIALAFVGIIWYAYPEGNEKYDGADVPLITADTTPYKFKPEDPGGLEVLHQDSTVFNPIEKKGGDGVEVLMPLPEEPLDKNAAIEAAKAKSPIDAPQPELNLDMQVQPMGDGTEKIISASDARSKIETPVAAPVEKKAVEKEPMATESKAKAELKKETPKPEAKKVEDVASSSAKASAAETGSTYIRLGSYRNESGAKQDWQKLAAKYPQQLKPLTMRIVKADLGPKGIYYRLEAGKVTLSRAKEVCDAIKAGPGAGCLIVK